MPPLNLGYLLQAGSRALTGARQGAREQEELNREREIEDSTRMFNEWAKRNQLEFQNRQLSTLDDQRRDIATGNNQTRMEVENLRKLVEEMREGGRNTRHTTTGQNVQNENGEFVNIPRNVQGPTGVRAPLPEARDGVPNSTPRPPAPRRMPVGEVEKISGVEGILDIASNAKTKLEGMIANKQNVTGPITGRLSLLREAAGMESPEVVGLRASLANIGSEEMLRRSGAAVTPSEFERLRPFLPNKNDREEELITKLEGFMREVRIIQEHRLNALDDFDYDTSKFRARRGPNPLGTVPPDAEADPDEALTQRFLQNRKRVP